MSTELMSINYGNTGGTGDRINFPNTYYPYNPPSYIPAAPKADDVNLTSVRMAAIENRLAMIEQTLERLSKMSEDCINRIDMIMDLILNDSMDMQIDIDEEYDEYGG